MDVSARNPRKLKQAISWSVGLTLDITTNLESSTVSQLAIAFAICHFNKVILFEYLSAMGKLCMLISEETEHHCGEQLQQRGL